MAPTWLYFWVAFSKDDPYGHAHLYLLGAWLFSLLTLLPGAKARPVLEDTPDLPICESENSCQNVIENLCESISPAVEPETKESRLFSRILEGVLVPCLLLTLVYFTLSKLLRGLGLGNFFGLAFMAILALVLWQFHPSLRRSFLNGLRLSTPLAPSTFMEMLVFDILCSFSKIQFLSILALAPACPYVMIMAYFVLLFPFMVRTKQCVLNGGFQLHSQINSLKYGLAIITSILTSLNRPQTQAGLGPSLGLDFGLGIPKSSSASRLIIEQPSLDDQLANWHTGGTLSLLALSFVMNFLWDVLMDWRLLRISRSSKGYFKLTLETQLGFTTDQQSAPCRFIGRLFVAVAVLFNLWVRLLPFSHHLGGPVWLSDITPISSSFLFLEILRRWVWTIIRLSLVHHSSCIHK